jgi:hypothetical protein
VHVSQKAMVGTVTVKKLEVDDEHYKPYLYLEKMKWIKDKKYARKYRTFDEYRTDTKTLKWRMKFVLKKKNMEMGTTYQMLNYHNANRNAYESC